MKQIDDDTWKIEKSDGFLDMNFMRANPHIAILRGCAWDPRTEKEVYSDNINPYGKYGYINRPKKK